MEGRAGLERELEEAVLDSDLYSLYFAARIRMNAAEGDGRETTHLWPAGP